MIPCHPAPFAHKHSPSPVISNGVCEVRNPSSPSVIPTAAPRFMRHVAEGSWHDPHLSPTQICHPEPAPFAGEGSLFSFCHPDRSGPIFSFAPNCGASGRAVEGSRRNPQVLPPTPFFEFRFSIFVFRVSLFATRFPVADYFPSRSNRATIYRITTYSPNPARQCYYSSRWVEHGIFHSPGGLA